MTKLTPKILTPEAQKRLQDLSASLKEITIGKDGWCYKYRDKKDIGDVIYKNFLEYNAQKADGKENIFAFSEELISSGILSQLQGFQVLAILIEEFRVNLDSERLLSILDGILEVVGTEQKNRFDATPYLPGSQQFDTENYIDTITWFVSCACSVFRLMIQKNFQIGEQREKRLVGLFRYCFEYLIDSFIETDKEGAFNCGWNYTKGCKEPSLYFTFSVSEVLIDIYATFENVIIAAETDLIQKEIEKKFSNFEQTEALRMEITQKKEQIQEINGAHLDRFNATDRSSEEEKRLFTLINSGRAVFEEMSPYAHFERQCKQAANCIWVIVKDKLTSRFFSADLVNDISEDVIEQSITSDSMFNSIFAINTVINAGLDEDADDMINYYTLNGSAEYLATLSEYDNMRDTLRLGYDNVYQMYNKLSKKGKEYKVNEYVLSFGENVDGDKAESVKEMRKARIRVFSLMPLLVKTKTSLGQFLIRYPQYDMQLYLEQILDRRYVNDEGVWWIWEKDGYSSSSNYYFVSALSDFFQYYDEYEYSYSQNAFRNEQQKKAIREKYLEELRTDGEIRQLNRDLNDEKKRSEALVENIHTLEEEVARLNNEIDNNPLNKALNEFIQKAVQKRITSILTEMFSDMAKDITQEAKQRIVQRAENATNEPSRRRNVAIALEKSSDQDERARFEESVRRLGLSLISEQLFGAVYADKTAHNNEDEFSNLEHMTSDDLKMLVYLYAQQILIKGSSQFVRTKGYDGLQDILQREVQRKNEEKNRRN